MIKYVSLYLGLLTGMQPVEVMVSPEVANVELLLDGTSVGRMVSEPWRTRVDFGPRLMPHHLLAVAYGGDGDELGRAEQIINLPRPRAEAGILLERDERGRVVAARVSWQSLSRATPRRVTATFDGAALPVADPRRIPIPQHEPEAFHILIVELEFSSREHVQTVAGFGGPHGGDVSTELTAVPVTASRRRLPPLSRLQGTVRKGDRTLPIVAVERGPAEILFVRDTAAAATIEEMGAREARGVGSYGVSSATGIATSAGGISGVAASSGEELRRMLTLDSEDDIRLVWPVTKIVERDEVRMELFPASPPFTAADGGVYWALTQEVTLDGEAEVQRLADAAAIAGLQAAAGNRRRAVILVVQPGAEDASRYRPADVRAYLRILGVPLHVWVIGDEEAPVAAGWGEVERIDSLRTLRRAVRRIESDLKDQAVLWVEGRHLPQELEVVSHGEIRPISR